jgi:hypothetical protein
VRLDLGVDGRDVGVDGVDPGRHPGQQEAVVVVEMAGERLFQLADLGPHPRPRHLCEHTFGSRSVQVLARDAAAGALQPALEVGDHPVHAWEDLVDVFAVRAPRRARSACHPQDSRSGGRSC